MTIIIPFHREINKTLGNKHDAQGSKVNKYQSQDVNLGDWSLPGTSRFKWALFQI